MALVHKAVFLDHSAEQMFSLVDRVEDCPLFQPWGGGVEVRERQQDRLVAMMTIRYHGVQHALLVESFCMRAEAVYG